jgi:mucin-19
LTINDSTAPPRSPVPSAARALQCDGERLSEPDHRRGGNTLLNGASVRTTGTQTYGDAVTLAKTPH